MANYRISVLRYDICYRLMHNFTELTCHTCLRGIGLSKVCFITLVALSRSAVDATVQPSTPPYDRTQSLIRQEADSFSVCVELRHPNRSVTHVFFSPIHGVWIVRLYTVPLKTLIVVNNTRVIYLENKFKKVVVA